MYVNVLSRNSSGENKNTYEKPQDKTEWDLGIHQEGNRKTNLLDTNVGRGCKKPEELEATSTSR
jgi:hypothetical protein